MNCSGFIQGVTSIAVATLNCLIDVVLELDIKCQILTLWQQELTER